MDVHSEVVINQKLVSSAGIVDGSGSLRETLFCAGCALSENL